MRKIIKIIPGILTSGILLFIIFKNFDFQSLTEKLKVIDVDQIIYLLLLTLLMILIRAIRWGAIAGVNKQKFVSYRVFEAISIGAFLNSIIPFGVGELYRIKEMKEIKKSGYGVAASTLIVERMMDMIFLFSIIFVMMFFLPFPEWVRNLLILISVFISIFALLILFVKKEILFMKIQEKRYHNMIMVFIIKFVQSLIHGFSDFKDSSQKRTIIMMTVVLWLVTSSIVLLKGDMFNLDFTFKVVLTSMALVNLSAIIPATPGMFGTYHLAVVTAMSIWGFSKVDCNGYAIFAHGTNYLSMIFIGIILGLIKYSKILFKSRGNDK